MASKGSSPPLYHNSRSHIDTRRGQAIYSNNARYDREQPVSEECRDRSHHRARPQHMRQRRYDVPREEDLYNDYRNGRDERYDRRDWNDRYERRSPHRSEHNEFYDPHPRYRGTESRYARRNYCEEPYNYERQRDMYYPRREFHDRVPSRFQTRRDYHNYRPRAPLAPLASSRSSFFPQDRPVKRYHDLDDPELEKHGSPDRQESDRSTALAFAHDHESNYEGKYEGSPKFSDDEEEDGNEPDKIIKPNDNDGYSGTTQVVDGMSGNDDENGMIERRKINTTPSEDSCNMNENYTITKKKCDQCLHYYPHFEMTSRDRYLVCLHCDLPSGWVMKRSRTHKRPYFFQISEVNPNAAKTPPVWEHPTPGNVLSKEFE